MDLLEAARFGRGKGEKTLMELECGEGCWWGLVFHATRQGSGGAEYGSIFSDVCPSHTAVVA